LAVRISLVAAAFVLASASCGGGSESAGQAPTTSTPTGTTTKARPAERFGYIRSVSTAGPAVTLAFDEAEFLTGDAAQKAAEEDGFVKPGESVPNDYYIRNPDKTARTLRLANDAKITHFQCSPCRDGLPGKLGPFLAAFVTGRRNLNDPYRGKYSQYWLTIRDGEVVAIDEQYVP
jgi:hypothetical protein